MRVGLMLALTALLAVLVSACGGGSSSSSGGSGEESEGGEPTSVTVGVLPFIDYQPWYVAHELGLDKELGYELKFKQFPLEPNEVSAMVRNEVQIGQGAIGSIIPLLPERPELRVFLGETQFRGFAFVARKGDYKNFEAVMAEDGDEKKAREDTIKQFEGQDIVTLESSYKATIAAALEEAGLTYGDVNVKNFNEGAAAAAAFFRGEGDIFMGGLTETVKMVKEHEDEYEILIGAENMGPPGLWFSNGFVLDSYLEQNRQQLLDLTAIWYRTMRFLKEDKEKTYPMMLKELNAQASTELDNEGLEQLIPEFEYFPTAEEAEAKTYNPSNAGYWKAGTEYLIAANENTEAIDSGSVKADEFVVQEELFDEFMKDKKLQEWVEAPLK